jgi:hypothetical protein
MLFVERSRPSAFRQYQFDRTEETRPVTINHLCERNALRPGTESDNDGPSGEGKGNELSRVLQLCEEKCLQQVIAWGENAVSGALNLHAGFRQHIREGEWVRAIYRKNGGFRRSASAANTLELAIS